MNKIALIIITIIAMTMQSCSQDNTSNHKKNMNNKTFYFIDFDYNKECGFAIYINDILVTKYINPVNIDYAITSINPYILKSGPQKIKIKLFPYFPNSILKNNLEFNLKIFFIENYNEEIIDTLKNIVFELPKVILANQQSEWVSESSFDVNIPYEVMGWENSQNLKEHNDLEVKVRQKFNSLISLIERKDSKKLINEFSNSIQESQYYYYLTNEQIKNSEDELSILIAEPKTKIASLDNTIVRYYANGKLVTLETIDGKPAIRITKKEDGYESEDNLPILLHIPQGSKELEIIR